MCLQYREGAVQKLGGSGHPCSPVLFFIGAVLQGVVARISAPLCNGSLTAAQAPQLAPLLLSPRGHHVLGRSMVGDFWHGDDYE